MTKAYAIISEVEDFLDLNSFPFLFTLETFISIKIDTAVNWWMDAFFYTDKFILEINYQLLYLKLTNRKILAY